MGDVDQYIARFPIPVQEILTRMRSIIKEIAGDAGESISYGMPAYKTNGSPLVYYAAYKNHIGFYATPNGHEKFKSELSIYKQGKGSVQFPLDDAFPFDLIKKIVKFRVEENRLKANKQ